MAQLIFWGAGKPRNEWSISGKGGTTEARVRKRPVLNFEGYLKRQSRDQLIRAIETGFTYVEQFTIFVHARKIEAIKPFNF
jgi:hypothetical protein